MRIADYPLACRVGCHTNPGCWHVSPSRFVGARRPHALGRPNRTKWCRALKPFAHTGLEVVARRGAEACGFATDGARAEIVLWISNGLAREDGHAVIE
jgi:hypothetical protein